jgi:small subunit ribosomal protein S17
MDSFDDTSYYDPVERADYSHLTNDELKDSSSIPGWDLLHSPPKDRELIPRGALVGTVVSTKMQKTVNVSIDRFKTHSKYRKRMRFTRKFMAHDESEVASTGDLVMIVPSHRISKHKHFMLREIIKAKGQL